MGVTTVTTGRILVGQRENQNGEEVETNIDKMDHLALSKVYFIILIVLKNSIIQVSFQDL